MILSAAIAVVQLVGLGIGPGAYHATAGLGLLLPLMFVEWLVTNAAVLAVYRKAGA
jgi:hypothetical protein